MRRFLSACALLSLVVVPAGALQAADLGLITGSEKGTYYQFGLNLQALARQHGLDLAVIPSRGSIENIYAVYQRPATQMGIVQADVLAFVTRVQSDPVLRRIARKTRMVFPLYNEEVHVLARRGITDFDDLADRRVAIGREGAAPTSPPASSSTSPRSRRGRWSRSTPTRPWPSSRPGGSTPCSTWPGTPCGSSGKGWRRPTTWSSCPS